MLFALGYNLMLGTTGLPSFGHGAFFGIGAYAFGLLQQRVLAPTSGSTSLGAMRRRRGARRARRRLHPAPARHLLRAADDRLRPGVLVRRRQVAQRHRRRGRAAEHRPAAAAARLRDGRTCAATRRSSTSASRSSRSPSIVLWRLVHSPFGRVLARDQAERGARRLRRLQRLALQVAASSRSRRRSPGSPARMFALAQQSAYPNVMSLHSSGFVVMMVLIGGGLVSFWGPAIGALFFILARDVLGAATETWLLWYGLLFVVDGAVEARGHRRPVAGAGGAARRARGAARGGAGGRVGGRGSARRRSMALFEATGLHKRFGDQVVLQDLSLSFEEGRLSGIMGPNGAGKTTCFNVLTGRYAPDRGRVHLRRRGHHRPAAAPDRAEGHLALVPGHEPVRRRLGARQRPDRAAARAPARLRRLARPARRLGAPSSRRRACSRASASPGKERAAARDLSYGERRALEIARRARRRAAPALPRRADRRPRRAGDRRGSPTSSASSSGS